MIAAPPLKWGTSGPAIVTINPTGNLLADCKECSQRICYVVTGAHPLWFHEGTGDRECRPMLVASVRHPAVYSPRIIWTIQDILDERLKCGRILDPFGGTGRLHSLQGDYDIHCVELEKEWATDVQGNARQLPFRDKAFDAIVTSPCYGNRMADHHDAKDGSERRTYKHYLGHDLRRDNGGAMQWGADYRWLHYHAYAECARVVRPSGIFLLNIKDHYRKGTRQHVSNWHYQCLSNWFDLVDVVRVKTPHYRFGAKETLVRFPERILTFVRRTE